MSSMSKRAQARTERELQDILTQPGNSTCADCNARNPAWASWSIGIFLCMRCATLHRKLGTHISKVKSLTMDTWTDEQVQNMRVNGNVAVNGIYNPKNKKPDMPLDADEVDNAMERFIRKKYQEKSLSDGRPEVPTRDDPPLTRSRSPEIAPEPLLPPKKKGFWTGFGLRASSSAYPLSKHDKKHRNEPRVDGAFRISSEDYTTKSKANDRTAGRRDLTNSEIEAKLLKLREMGFTDVQKNTTLLKKARGDVELVIASLVKHATRENDLKKSVSNPTETKNKTTENNPNAQSIAATKDASNNPFDMLDRAPQQQQFDHYQQQAVTQTPMPSTNPWQAAIPNQQTTGLEQSFTAMQVQPSPLFPHNTGGYITQPDPRFSQSMTPPVPSMPQAYSATASPISGTNPFAYQTPLSAHSTGSNPYAVNMLHTPPFAPSTNPFLPSNNNASQPASPSLTNPFGLPPSHVSTQNNPLFPSQPEPSGFPVQNYQAPFLQNHQQSQTMSPDTSSPGFPNFNYGQPAGTFQQQIPPQQISQTFQQPYPNQPQQIHQQPLMAQQTGRYDKNSIMALYSHPQFASQRTLAAIPEPNETDHHLQSSNSTPVSASVPQQGSMPQHVSTTMHSANQVNRNPFLTNNVAVTANATSSAQYTAPVAQFSPLSQNNPYSNQPVQSKPMMSGNPFGPQGVARHTSADSVSVNNPSLMDGRHSPDAWGGLSARYIR